jgi:hypothetical protein
MVEWKCLNEQCGHVFNAEPMTRSEYQKNPWRWCAKCGASSRAMSVCLCEGTFSK